MRSPIGGICGWGVLRARRSATVKRICLLWLLCAATVSGFALDREAYTFSQYELDVRLEPGQQRIGVRGTVTLRNDTSLPQKNAVLQISSSLSWRSIRAQARPVQFLTQPYESDIDHTGQLSEAIVTLPKEVEPGREVQLEIGYEGIIPQDATRLTRIGAPKQSAMHSDWDEIAPGFSAVRGIGYVAWYPIATEAASLSDANSVQEAVARWKSRETSAVMQVNFSWEGNNGERPSLLIGNAPNCNRTAGESSGGEALTANCRFERLGLAVPTFVVGNYSAMDSIRSDIFYAQDHKREAETFASAAEATLPFVGEWFGSPGAKTSVVELPDSDAAPFESGSVLLTPLTKLDAHVAQLMLISEFTQAAMRSPRPWIQQGLAHFAQALYREKQEGRRAALEYLGAGLATLSEAENTSRSPSSPPNSGNAGAKARVAADSKNTLASNNEGIAQRSKAGYVWWMLRDMIGDTALKKAVAQYRFQDDTTPSFMEKLVENAAGRDLSWFFKDWVYEDRGLADFKVASVYPTKTSQGYLVTVTVENMGQAGAEVPVRLRLQAGGEATQRVQIAGRASGVVRFEAPSAPEEVQVNDGSVPESDTSNNTFQVTLPQNSSAFQNWSAQQILL